MAQLLDLQWRREKNNNNNDRTACPFELASCSYSGDGRHDTSWENQKQTKPTLHSLGKSNQVTSTLHILPASHSKSICDDPSCVHISGALWPGPLLRTYRFVWGIRKKAFPGGIGFRYFFMLKLDIRRGLIVGSSGRRCRCRPLKSNHSVSQSIKGGLAAIRGSQTHSRRSKLKNDKNPNRKSSSQA